MCLSTAVNIIFQWSRRRSRCSMNVSLFDALSRVIHPIWKSGQTTKAASMYWEIYLPCQQFWSGQWQTEMRVQDDGHHDGQGPAGSLWGLLGASRWVLGRPQFLLWSLQSNGQSLPWKASGWGHSIDPWSLRSCPWMPSHMSKTIRREITAQTYLHFLL